MSQKEDLRADRHPKIIKAEIHKRGLSFRTLSLNAGYSRDSLKSVLRTPLQALPTVVADALGIAPEVIWPSRYRTESYMRKAS
ncbi:helix-turn-helix domain-containing protein [Serratia symbiotica]|uniref:helix-turn-helix domain-containing protein n=1 Tax=Serratia symbiotica TaxID=138074 RepID=UPI002090669E|nr:helix-turn-helix domain-containing protein [Serratia symbiotica]USS96860.1 helix-turn-helix domain-containing protein [Serratia symbiotica]